MKNRFWKTQNWCFGTQNLHFPNLMVQLLPIITPLITNTGPIDMFFTKKYNYFSQESRWNYPFLSQPHIKGCFCTLKLGDKVWWPVLYLGFNPKQLQLGIEWCSVDDPFRGYTHISGIKRLLKVRVSHKFQNAL